MRRRRISIRRQAALAGSLVALAATLAAPAQAQRPDFNGDGRSDLAIGVLGEDLPGAPGAGAVSVLYGSANGVSATGDQFWHQNRTGVLETAESQDGFGFALAWGDFDKDGFTDLAIGVPGEDVTAGDSDGGAVNVLYGSSSGLTAAGDQVWTQASPGIPGSPGNEDAFGWSLASGDFNGDGFGDLAVGIPVEDVPPPRGLPILDAGAVQVLYGSSSGLTTLGNEFWHQAVPDVEENAEKGDAFGSSLTAGDFDGDGFADLAVGIPSEDVRPQLGAVVPNAGAVQVLYGSGSGLATAGDQVWHQAVQGVEGQIEKNDAFGSSLAAGDFDGDGRADLAMGVTGEELSGEPGAGAVNVVYGTAWGLAATADQIWHQDVTGIADKAEEDDAFGWSLAAGDFDGNGFADLAVGARAEDVSLFNSSVSGAGAVNVIYGSPAGLSNAGDQFWQQAAAGGGLEAGDLFGHSLSRGDFNGDGKTDLAIGAVLEDIASSDEGAVNVIYGSGGGLTATGAQFWHQDSQGVLDNAEQGDVFGRALARP